MIAAVVPVKRLETGKSRLERTLGRPATRRLMLAMLEDVLEALRAVPRLEPVAVVTPDERVAQLAERAGARVLLGPDPGLDASLERAAKEVVTPAHEGLLVVLGDVAGVEARDVERLLDEGEALGAPCVVLAPSGDGGTSALLRRPPSVIPTHFGPESAARHQRAAREAGVPYRELALPSLTPDLDCEDDLRAFLRAPGGGPRTRRLLHELGFAEGA